MILVLVCLRISCPTTTKLTFLLQNLASDDEAQCREWNEQKNSLLSEFLCDKNTVPHLKILPPYMSNPQHTFVVQFLKSSLVPWALNKSLALERLRLFVFPEAILRTE